MNKNIKPEHITTYSGIYFYPTQPEADKIQIEDIAHALSLTCRGNGHVKTFFSVGQHCINCCKEAMLRGYSNRVALACLLHDASEAYMSDVPRPFKKLLTDYIEAENQLLSIIYQHFLGSDLTTEEAKQVKEIDDAMLYYDLKILLNDTPDKPAPQLQITLDYTVQPFQQVEQEYKDLYQQLKAQL